MLEAQQLSCRRNGVELFRNLTFTLQPGQWLQIVGPNGSGKSSLLRVLLGLLPSQAGKLCWEGREIRFPDRIFLNQVKYLGHRIGIQDRLTPRENLRGWLNIQRTLAFPSTEANYFKMDLSLSIESALENWDLLEVGDTLCEYLSQGQCQRLALARLTLLPAKLWVLDEPCTALDGQGVQYLKKIVENHLKKAGMLVMVSHTAFMLYEAGQTLTLGTASVC